jgi:hypothetical protein
MLIIIILLYIYLKILRKVCLHNHYFYYYCIRNTAIEWERNMRRQKIVKEKLRKFLCQKAFYSSALIMKVGSSRCIAETFFVPCIFLRKTRTCLIMTVWWSWWFSFVFCLLT